MGDKLKNYSKKPEAVKRLQRSLEENVVGRVIPYYRNVYDETLGVTLRSSTEISKYLEEVTFTYAELDPKVAKVETEPNGNRSFPDLRVTYRNNYQQGFEVKTWGARREFDVAKMGPLHKSLLELDPKYFTTWYVEWSYVNEPAGIRIQGVRVSRIWDICGWNKTLDVKTHNKSDLGHVALRPQADCFTTPVELVFAIVGTTVADPDEQLKMFSQGVRMLKAVKLYDQVDLLILKNRVNGTMMREAKHEFIRKFRD